MLKCSRPYFVCEERARKIGIWAATFIFSPYLGPFLSGIMVEYTTWQNSLWLNTGLIGLGLILVTLFGAETAHRKDPVVDRSTGIVGRVCELVGVSGYRSYHGGVKRVAHDMALLVTRPHFLCLLGKDLQAHPRQAHQTLTLPVFYMLSFMWSIGINATLVLFTAPPPPIGFGYSNLKISLMYIGPMVSSYPRFSQQHLTELSRSPR
jgi:MFS family permease